MSCGTGLPDSAHFCWKCGQAINREAMAAPRTPFETCTLSATYSLDRKSTVGLYCDRWWEARAEGEAGAGDSAPLAESAVVTLTGLTLLEKATRNPSTAARERFGADWEAAYLSIPAELTGLGWEPEAVDQEGHGTRLRRARKSESRG